jgi:D-serine deaminase-like pyridoxal phosphate-dependent protein
VEGSGVGLEGEAWAIPSPAVPAERLYQRYESAFAELTPPFAFVDLDALRANARAMLDQAAGKPIRVASKSVRCTELVRRILALDDGFRGLLNFTLPEALHLAGAGFEDMVVAYPTSDRAAIAALAELGAERPTAAAALMVDSTEHLDLIEAAAPDPPAPIRVAIELDVGWWPLGGRIRIGPKRSPIRTPSAARALADDIARRRRLQLVGLMAYEGHVAGVGDRTPGQRLRNQGIRVMQRLSMRELAERRAEVVAAVREVSELEFVNGGGTGSLSRTTPEPAVTEVAAGSGFFAPVLFDHYRSLELRPAAGFSLPVSRRPGPGVVTALGGGYVASGVPAQDRLPQPLAPPGLRLDSLEGAGEVQTPLRGRSADGLAIGDRVYLRHAKAGELCERFNSVHLIEGDRVADELPTYRGEGRAFL